MRFEKVHLFRKFFDCPRSGIADFEGKPHFFRWLFDEAIDDYGRTCTLTPISQEHFAIALEDWAIWQHWKTAFKKGQVAIEAPRKDHHPALPQDETRFREIAPELARIEEAESADDGTGCFQAVGNFRRVTGAAPNSSDGPWEVCWERC